MFLTRAFPDHRNYHFTIFVQKKRPNEKQELEPSDWGYSSFQPMDLAATASHHQMAPGPQVKSQSRTLPSSQHVTSAPPRP